MSTALVCTIVCPPRSWCRPVTALSHINRTTRDLRWGRKSLTALMTACISRALCATIFEMLTTVPVSSVSLTGLPSPNWTHLWRESLPSPWRRGVDLAGLLEMPTRPPLTEPIVELWSGWTSSQSSGTMMWRPTTGPDEDGVFPVVPAKPWTPACREACADLWLWCWDWSSSVDERPGLWDTSSVGAPLWIVECWTASRWTGSPDLGWGLTSRNWWSVRETGVPWWSSGRAVWPVLEYLLWSASCLSRRVASHLAALTALRRATAAWWTPGVMSLTRKGGKWTGRLACWPRSVDTCGRPGASEHEGRHRGCLSILSTPDFWWLNGRTFASPSWSVELPCRGLGWRDRSQAADLLSSLGPGTAGCSTQGMSRWWPALWPPSTARHPRLAEGLVGCFWSGSWCTDGWAEVAAEMQCPPCPRQCRWPSSCPADSASAGQSLPGEPPPGTHQRCLVEEAAEDLPGFLRQSG